MKRSLTLFLSGFILGGAFMASPAVGTLLIVIAVPITLYLIRPSG